MLGDIIRSIEELKAQVHNISTEELAFVLDNVNSLASYIKYIRDQKLEEELYRDDPDTPYWQR